MTIFAINGIPLPPPKRGLKVSRSQIVNSGRNALGQIVSEKIGRRQIKLDGLEWPYLSADDWSTILQEVEKFEGELEYWDALEKKIIKRKVYWGDATETPFIVNSETGEVLSYIECRCNLIDCGY